MDSFRLSTAVGNNNMEVNYESGGGVDRGMIFRQSLRFKIMDMFSCLMRRKKNDLRQDSLEEQEIELIKGIRNGSPTTSVNLDGSPEVRDSSEYLNHGEDDQMEIDGFERSWGKTAVTWTFIVLTLGLLRLIFHWWPQFMLHATHRRCSLRKAEKILVLEHYQKKYKRYHVKPVINLTPDLFRTTKFFGVANLHSQEPSSKSCNTWDQRLENTLQSIGTPKLAIPSSDGSVREVSSTRIFTCKKLRYIWNDEQGKFLKLEGFDQAFTHNLHQSAGLTIFEQCQRRIIYGNNEIKVHVQGIVKLLFLEVLNPFYVFQIFSVTLWLSDNYIYFAVGIILMSMFGITSTIYQTRQNQKKLKTTVQSSDVVMVIRGEEESVESIPTEHLVPGDLIVIPPHGCTMHCDAALLKGNCIVNESLLTGESVPVTKIPLPNRSDVTYNIKEHDRSTLFCGTQVIQTRYYGNERVLAVVLRSGFLTAKGNLVRSIMYPPPVDYKFEKDSYKFVAVLACIACVGFINSIFTKIAHGETLRNIIVDSLDLITIVVPPALPAAMTVGRFYAQRRLQKKGIYCISPRAINVSGSIDCVCFDKTGTLTEEGLDLWGAVPTTTKEVIEKKGGKIKCDFGDPIRDAGHLSQTSLLTGMAACHSLTRIDDNLIGDPLDLKMFEWTGWILEEPGCADIEKFDKMAPTIVRPSNVALGVDSSTEIREEAENSDIGIVRQFPFSSSLQRMSVITRKLGAPEFEIYCKGSPEMITSLSQPQSVPDNFAATLERYTQQGYRVIALAHKSLPGLNYAKAQRVFREDVETSLSFLGLIVLENRLKPETNGVMRILKNASIRSIMVTGDNMLTAISVARECGMLDGSEKVIVVGAESITEGIVPRLQFSLANKICPMDLETSPSPGSPANSILSGTSSGMDLLPNSESPYNRYHFAVTGHAFGIIRTYYPELLPKLLVRGAVFARMSPEQKQQLVELLQGLGYFVGMCGDGANDCGALKAAHAGISLSDTESSVASPFTSNEANITCVPHLIREGRGALVTSFGIFKYMAVYSLTQFVSVIILYYISSNLADLQFLYIDLFLISVFALFWGHAEPYPGPLVKTPPSASLISAAPILSILCHMTVIVGAQTLAFLYVQQQPWYEPFEPSEEHPECYENFALFAVSAFQYIIMAIVFSRGKPYRKSVVTNPGLITSLIALTALTTYIVLWPCSGLVRLLQLKTPPEFEFRLKLVGIAAVNLLLAFAIELFLVDLISSIQCRSCSLSSKKRPRPDSKKMYLEIEYDLALRTDWPPMSYSGANGKGPSNTEKYGTVNEVSSIKMNGHVGSGERLSRHTRTLSIPIPIISNSHSEDCPSKVRHSSAVEQKNMRNQQYF